MSRQKEINNNRTKKELFEIINQLKTELQKYQLKEQELFFKEEELERKLISLESNKTINIFIQPKNVYFNLLNYAKNTNQTIEQIINQMINYFYKQMLEFNNNFLTSNTKQIKELEQYNQQDNINQENNNYKS